jgi:hypothetical protein
MRTFGEIIQNQKEFKDQLKIWIIDYIDNYEKELKLLEENCYEEFLDELKKFNLKFKTINKKDFLNSLFVTSKKRSSKFYIYWLKEEEQATIGVYEKETTNKPNPNRFRLQRKFQ